jgi:hypothetical protein
VKTHAQPPRLLSHPELGEVLRAGTTEDDLSAERLQRNGELLAERLGSLTDPPSGDGSPPGAGGSAGSGAAMAVKAALLAGGAALAIGASWMWPRTEPASPSGTSESRATPEALEPASPPEEAAIPGRASSAPRQVPRQAVSPEEPPRSTLAEQLELVRSARAATRAGEPRRALELLDELDRRFRDSPLRDEAALERAEALLRAGDDTTAVVLLTRLAEEPSLAGKRPAILHTLGDAYVRQGDCTKAIASFEAALAAGLGEEARPAARLGIEHCSQKR